MDIRGGNLELGLELSSFGGSYRNFSKGYEVFYPQFQSATGLTTIDVSQHSAWLTSNGSPVTITAIAGGHDGQEIVLVCLDSNTTVQRNGSGNIHLSASFTSSGNRATLRLVSLSGHWYETGRSIN